MKLLFFDFTINFGGAPQGSISLARRLSKYNEVNIVDVYGSCVDYCSAVRNSNLPLHVLYPEGKKTSIGSKGKLLRRSVEFASQLGDFMHIFVRLRKKLTEIKPDVVWINNEKSLVFLLGPLLYAKFPIVYYVRGWATQDQFSPLLRFLLKRKVTYILAHAKASIEQLKASGISSEKIVYTPNSVEITIKRTEALSSPPNLPGIDKPLRILLPAARPVREKGHLTAVRALRRLIDGGTDAVLWLPGKNPAGVGLEFLSELKSLISELKLEDRIHFIGWREDLQSVIANSDIVILPSYTEGFPRVIIEAMLLSVPVCATPVGGIPEAIIDGQTGFIVEIDNDIMLADKISRLFTDKNLKNEIINRAYGLASEKFLPEIQTTIVHDVFKKAING